MSPDFVVSEEEHKGRPARSQSPVPEGAPGPLPALRAPRTAPYLSRRGRSRLLRGARGPAWAAALALPEGCWLPAPRPRRRRRRSAPRTAPAGRPPAAPPRAVPGAPHPGWAPAGPRGPRRPGEQQRGARALPPPPPPPSASELRAPCSLPRSEPAPGHPGPAPGGRGGGRGGSGGPGGGSAGAGCAAGLSAGAGPRLSPSPACLRASPKRWAALRLLEARWSSWLLNPELSY